MSDTHHCDVCAWVGPLADYPTHLHIGGVVNDPPMYPPGLGRIHVGLHTPGGKLPGGVEICSVCGQRSDGYHPASAAADGADLRNAMSDLGRR